MPRLKVIRVAIDAELDLLADLVVKKLAVDMAGRGAKPGGTGKPAMAAPLWHARRAQARIAILAFCESIKALNRIIDRVKFSLNVDRRIPRAAISTP